MPFEGNYSLAQSGEATLIITDTSTGSDTNLTSRKIYLYKYDNTTIVPSGTSTSYIVWAIADNSIILSDILSRDYALNITVEWISSDPEIDGVYTINYAFCFKNYSEEFMLSLAAEKAVAKPNIVNDNGFVFNWAQLRLYVDSAFDLVDSASDVMNSQVLLDSAYNMTSHPNDYF